MARVSVRLLVLTAALVAYVSPDTAAPITGRPQAAISPPNSSVSKSKPGPAQDRAGIRNLMQVSPGIYSGSEPHGEEGFASLAELGIATMVSVDGAKPNLEVARKHGLRYVHIPIGYDGVPEEAGQALARLVREAAAPFYFHCHHGKHRGPAAAAVACVAEGDVENKDAIQILMRAGTSKDYPGLWRDVENYRPPPAGAELPELVEVAAVGSFAAAMAQIDRAYDHLKLCRDAKWGVPPDHPDLLPAHEALLLQEGLHEAARNLGDDEYDERFKAWLKQAEQMAIDLRDNMEANNAASVNEGFLLVERSCRQCHQTYRD